MKQFMGDDFLLKNKSSERLYHEFAKDQPIYDYHCHLIPGELATNKRFTTITDMWLGGDHYKWRAMRANGIPEAIITGKDADPYDRFLAWAKTVEKLMGNPLYHWTHLELKRYFHIDEPFNEKNAKAVFDETNRQLPEQPESFGQGNPQAVQGLRNRNDGRSGG